MSLREATQAACMYDVRIRHTRRSPLRHAFDYRSPMWLVDLDRPPLLPAALRCLARFDRADHLDIQAIVSERGVHPARILTLTGARSLGYTFNPLSVHWCYGDDGGLLAEVAEVHNTYGGRHAYVVDPGASGWVDMPKVMPVSPFHPPGGTYRIRVSRPGRTVGVSVSLEREGADPFSASLAGTGAQSQQPISCVRCCAIRSPSGGSACSSSGREPGSG